MIEADRADHSRAKLDHDLIVPITRCTPASTGQSKKNKEKQYECSLCSETIQ